MGLATLHLPSARFLPYTVSMISHLKGSIFYKNDKYLVIEVHDIGYKVYGTSETLSSGGIGQTISLWIHHVIREDASDLFGFKTKDELEFFELLISISGIGPRTALGILNVTTVQTLKRAISSGDTSHLTKVSGIGKKNADKIVLELKDKFAHIDDVESSDSDVDVIEALQSLGYNQTEARKAMKEIDSTKTTQEKIKLALKQLGSSAH